MGRLASRAYVVTGGAREIALAFAREGSDIAVVDGTVLKLGDEDGGGMTSGAKAGWESVDGFGAAAG